MGAKLLHGHMKKKNPKMYEVLGLGNSDLFLNKVKWANFEIQKTKYIQEKITVKIHYI